MAYDHARHPAVHMVAEAILSMLLDISEVKGGVISGTWRPATVVLTTMVFPGQRVVTSLRSDTHHDTDAYTRYFRVMAALTMLEEEGMVTLHKDTSSGHTYRITIKEEDK